MARIYPEIEPECFNDKYRQYVATKELSARVAKRNYDNEKTIQHQTQYLNVPYNVFSSLVKNSHQYPRGDYNPIKPYQQKPVLGSKLIKEIETTPIYWGSRKYTRANCPKLQAHFE